MNGVRKKEKSCRTLKRRGTKKRWKALIETTDRGAVAQVGFEIIERSNRQNYWSRREYIGSIATPPPTGRKLFRGKRGKRLSRVRIARRLREQIYLKH